MTSSGTARVIRFENTAPRFAVALFPASGTPLIVGEFYDEDRARRYAAFENGSALPPKEATAIQPKPELAKSSQRKPFRRFTDTPDLHPEEVRSLPDDHPALAEMRTLFPTTVKNPRDVDRVLVSGGNNRKLGDRIVKGPWAGMPLYQLTLEERATCPGSCYLLASCYGNGMQMARRHEHGADLLSRLDTELDALNRKNPGGFVVRLHTLGDFWSVEYVRFWKRALQTYPALRVYGYTARPVDGDIGREILRLTETDWDRFAIRFSTAEPGPQGSTTIFRMPEGPVVAEGIVCPAETGRTDCCGTCGLCWHPAAKEKTIVFIAHGPRWKGSEKTGPAKERSGKARPDWRDALRESRHADIVAAVGTLNAAGTPCNSPSVAKHTGYNPDTCKRDMKALTDAGRLVKEGDRRTAVWRLPGDDIASNAGEKRDTPVPDISREPQKTDSRPVVTPGNNATISPDSVPGQVQAFAQALRRPQIEPESIPGYTNGGAAEDANVPQCTSVPSEPVAKMKRAPVPAPASKLPTEAEKEAWIREHGVTTQKPELYRAIDYIRAHPDGFGIYVVGNGFRSGQRVLSTASIMSEAKRLGFGQEGIPVQLAATASPAAPVPENLAQPCTAGRPRYPEAKRCARAGCRFTPQPGRDLCATCLSVEAAMRKNPAAVQKAIK